MSYCAPLGIPHSEFLGWNEEDQDKALSWHQRDKETCSRCGTHPSDWKLVRFPFTAQLEICLGCEMLDWMRKDDNEAMKRPGVHPVLKPSRSLLLARGAIKDG